MTSVKTPEGSIRDGRLFASAAAAGNVSLFSSLRADNIEHAVHLAEMLGHKARAEREQAALDRELGELLRGVASELDM